MTTEPSNDKLAFSLVTDDLEVVHFGIDEEMYELHAFAQLTPNEAARLTVLYRRMNIIAGKTAQEENAIKLQNYADQTAQLQDDLLAMMTTIPDEVREKLRVDHRNVILRHIARVAQGPEIECKTCLRKNPGDALFCSMCAEPLTEGGKSQEVGEAVTAAASES